MKDHNIEPLKMLIVAVFGLASWNLVLQKRLLKERQLVRQVMVAQWALGEKHGRQGVLDEVRMLAHGQLQAHVIALQHCLASAAAAPLSEYIIWVLKAQEQAQQLHGHVRRLHTTTRETLVLINLEQAVCSITKSLSAAYPACACHVEVLGYSSAQLATEAQQALILVLYNALQNAYRHAHPSSILVQLQYAPDAVILIVSDDGCGLTWEDTGVDGHGLHDMQRVIQQHNGMFTSESAPDRGTCITAVLPYRSSRQCKGT